jgi:hypothetical protein
LLLFHHVVEGFSHVLVLNSATKALEGLCKLVIGCMAELETLLDLFLHFFHAISFGCLRVNLLKVIKKLLLLSFLFSLLELMIELGLDLGYPTVLKLLSEKQVFHLCDLMIALLKLVWGDMLKAFELHLLQVLLTMEALTGELLLDLLLKRASSLRFSQIGGDLVEGVEADTATFTDHITCGEI